MKLMSPRPQSFDLQTMAKTIWAEARGEGYQGMTAVAWIIRNRAADPKKNWWGESVSEVCLKPWQFSCWNANDPNRDALEAVSLADPYYIRAHGVAALVLTGDLPDPTDGATHYMRRDIVSKVKWDDNMICTAVIGRHAFFRER